MKTIDPWQQRIKMPKIRKALLASLIIIVIILMLAVAGVYLLVFLYFQEIPYQVHHPAIYYVQDNFFKLGENVYYMKDGKCVAFDDKKEIRQIDLEHISNDFYVTNDILYVYLDSHIYAYNSNFEEVSIYDTGSIIDFIVLGNYVYIRDYNHDKKETEFYKYSTITHTKELLDWNGQYPAQFISEGIYYDNIFHRYDDNSYFIRQLNLSFYNGNYERIEMKIEKNSLIINDKSFDFQDDFGLGEQIYLNSEYFLFQTFNPDHENCSKYTINCISQLKDVKLWKYNYKTEQLSLVKRFNDYTILVSFDENNYHYYYDGKLYSNDIEVEKAPKIEVGDIFTYYTSESPNLYQEDILKSQTYIAYISGKFYVIHNEINSDVEEFP